MGLGGHDQLLGKIRGQPVVTVCKLDVLAVGKADAPVTRFGGTGVGLIQQGNAVVLLRKAGADGKGVVGGAVVQQQDLDAFIGLCADAFHTAGSTVCCVVHGHDDAHKGKIHGVSFFQMRLWVRATASESFCTGPLGSGLSNRLR